MKFCCSIVEEHSIECGDNVVIMLPSNIYCDRIGDDVHIGPFVEIQAGVTIGSRVKIGSHTFICRGVHIGFDVFIGHGVMFCNDREPRASVDGRLKGPEDWTCEGCTVGDGASIGSGAVILPGVSIGKGAMIGAGAVVSRDVTAGGTVIGNPAR